MILLFLLFFYIVFKSFLLIYTLNNFNFFKLYRNLFFRVSFLLNFLYLFFYYFIACFLLKFYIIIFFSSKMFFSFGSWHNSVIEDFYGYLGKLKGLNIGGYDFEKIKYKVNI